VEFGSYLLGDIRTLEFSVRAQCLVVCSCNVRSIHPR